MIKNKFSIISILLLCLTGCAIEPPSENLTLFISNVWNVFFSVGYISLLIGIIRFKSDSEHALCGFGTILLIAAYMSIMVFTSYTGASLELVLPYNWLK